MNNGLERILNFEGQEVKVKTDKGIELFNLANSAMVLGITKKANSGKLIVNWKSGSNSILNKLNTIYSGGSNNPPQIIEEIEYVLSEIEETDDRKQIFISRKFTSLIAMECHNDKAIKYKTWLATLDEAYSNGQLLNNPLMQFGDMAQQINGMANTMQQIGQAFTGIQRFVQDSIQAKDVQIDEVKSLIGLYSRNVSDLTKKLKQKVKEKYNKNNIWANSSEYIIEKESLFKYFNVSKWESIPVIKYREVEKYIENIK